MKTFRSVVRYLVPAWLSAGDGGIVLDTICYLLDDSVDRVRQGVLARFPSRAAPDALDALGEERGIPRGRSEPAEHYAQRLIGWRYPRGHRVRGSAYALLNQVSEYFGGIACATVDWRQNRHDRTAAGVESYTYNYPWVWDTDPRKARFWVVLTPGALMRANPNFGDPTLYGGALGTVGYSIGQVGATPDDAAALRALFTSDVPWKPAGTLQQWLIVNLDGTTQTPDATWANWSKNVAGTQVRSRYAGWRYWALTPELKAYPGKATNYAALITLPGGGTYAGSATSYPATIPLSRGGTYAGSAITYPATIPLLDDGSTP